MKVQRKKKKKKKGGGGGGVVCLKALDFGTKEMLKEKLRGIDDGLYTYIRDTCRFLAALPCW
jgi:hypothetical protein